METKLSGNPETLLIPLWARATERIQDRPIIEDAKAVEILSQIDYDFSTFSTARLSQLGVAIRTMLLDRAVRDVVNRYPGAAEYHATRCVK